MKYMVLCTVHYAIGKEVTDYMSRGWELYGNPFALDGKVCQAMVKYPQNVVWDATYTDTVKNMADVVRRI